MTTLEELERRKKELELKRDIAKLERNERLAKEVPVSVGAWSWLWVGPLAVVSFYFLLIGLVDGKPLALLVGLACLAPTIGKLFFRK